MMAAFCTGNMGSHFLVVPHIRIMAVRYTPSLEPVHPRNIV